ncbi:glycosyltransferase family 4 protein [Candidatus Gracilibacteria bacterium]|nr:glycosyltransferase family 4 protein [Candidatus Gracilibacteria bacterium]MCF7819477.1 glycosyltransferase family 4 protein [Candidatus Gracilibacteria bacterium]
MKIGIDARMFSDSFTGIGRYNFELTKRFFVLRPDIEWILFLNEPEYSQFYFPENIQKILVDAPHYSFSEQWKFLRLLQREQCDLVHFTHFNAPIFYSGTFVTTIHDTTISFYPGKKMNSWWRKWAYEKVIDHAVRDAARLITVSENTKKDVERLFDIDSQKIKTIWNGIGEEFQPFPLVEEEAVRSKFHIGSEFLLYTGNWREHKNLPRLIRAFGKILRETKRTGGPSHLQNLQLIITGKEDPYYPEVKKTISELGLQDSVQCIGLVSREDLLRLYSAASVFVFPSLYEGFGLPPLEAMQSETPVAASRISSIPEICGEGVQYFDPENVDDMAQNIQRLLVDEPRRKELIQKGKERVQRFSWDQAAEETLKVYDSVLK